MDEEKIKEILDEKQEQSQQQHHKKKTFWNNKKTVKGKALSAWLIVMIVIFMLFTFGLGIYLGKEVFTEKEKKSNNQNNNIVENNNNNDNLNDNGNDSQDVPESIKEANELLRDLTAFNNVSNVEDRITYYANNKIVDASSLDHEIVYQIIFNKYYFGKNLKEISLDDFNNKVKEMFDDSYSYVAKDYSDKCSGNGYKLDGNKYVYVPSNGGCGGTGYGFDIDPYKVITINKNINRLEIKVKVLFGKMVGEDVNRSVIYYSDYAKTKLVDGANQDNYEDYLNEGSTYKFTFINRNGIYLFSRSELD